jgi:SNF2 family DNA or RNA helicase
MDNIPKPTFGRFTLHPHQAFAVKWMMERESDDVMNGGFLCDDMGLGKTVTTIGLMINKPVARTLVLAPIAVLQQWIRTILSAEGPAVYEYNKHEWRCVGGNARKGRVFVTNYDKLVSCIEMFEAGFNRIICDEAHILRSYGSKKTTAIRKVPCDKYWFLTGTPIVNSKMDLVCLVSLANKSVRPFGHFSDETIDGWMKSYALHRTTEQLRELLADVLPQPPIVHTHRLPFTTESEAIFYRGIQGRIEARLAQLIEQDSPNGLQIIALLTRLRQISVHPQVYIQSKKKKNNGYVRADWKEDSTKTDAIVKILNSEKDPHAFVIFCNFKEEIEILKERLSREPNVGSVFTYEGCMNEKTRSEIVEKSEDAVAKTPDVSPEKLDEYFTNLPTDIVRHISKFVGKSHTVMLAQIQCAGTGLNLQHFDRVIFTTPWWTAALMDQAAGRVLRLGQKRQVHIHHVQLEEESTVSLNIDDYMNEKVEEKRLLCRRLLAAADRRVME